MNQENQPDLTPEKQKQIEKINQYMAEQKPFLNPELTLMELSQYLNIPKHQITLLLNNHLGKNFFEYVNEFRIEETKKRMIDPQYDISRWWPLHMNVDLTRNQPSTRSSKTQQD